MNKKIRIFTKGILPLKGNITGPILTPYMESTDNIFKLIAAGIKVFEVLDSGSQVKLTVHNFDKDNNEFIPEKTKSEEDTDTTVEHFTQNTESHKAAVVEVTPEPEVQEDVQPAEIPEEAVLSTEEVVEDTTNDGEDAEANSDTTENQGYTGYAQRNNKKKKKHHNNNGGIQTDEYTVE